MEAGGRREAGGRPNDRARGEGAPPFYPRGATGWPRWGRRGAGGVVWGAFIQAYSSRSGLVLPPTSVHLTSVHFSERTNLRNSTFELGDIFIFYVLVNFPRWGITCNVNRGGCEEAAPTLDVNGALAVVKHFQEDV